MLIIQANVKRIVLRLAFKSSKLTFDPKKDYFKILELDKGATEAQIKSQYYRLAMRHHPDLNKGIDTKFKLINEAYSVLSNKETKNQYLNARGDTVAEGRKENPFYSSQSQNDSNNYYGHAHRWENNSSSSHHDYGNPYEHYGRYKQYAEYQHQEFMKKQREKYQAQNQTDDERLTVKEYIKLRKLLSSAFIAGFLISLVFLIPQIILGPYSNQNKSVYFKNSASKYAYPYQQPDPIEYINPKYLKKPQPKS